MPAIVRLFVFTLVAFQLISCGKKSSTTTSPNTPPDTSVPTAPTGPSPFQGNAPFTINEIGFDNSVPSDQQALLKKDFELIARSNFEADTDSTTITGITDFSNRGMAKWLTDRTHYILGEKYDLYDGLQVAQSYNKYVTTVFSELLPGFGDGVTVMRNMGASTYITGKDNSRVYSLKIAGSDVVVKSPRAGVIQIGAGLFDESRFSLNSTAASIARIGTLFHESRHSDGNGSNVGFSHAMCTSGSFVGDYACESYTNGPYMVQVVMLKKFYKMCTDCTSSETSKLQTLMADRASRLVSGAKSGDPRPEKIE